MHQMVLDWKVVGYELLHYSANRRAIVSTETPFLVRRLM
jgi:hypothetical protein